MRIPLVSMKRCDGSAKAAPSVLTAPNSGPARVPSPQSHLTLDNRLGRSALDRRRTTGTGAQEPRTSDHDVFQPHEDHARPGRLPAWHTDGRAQPVPGARGLDALAHGPSRPRSARRQLPAARGRYEGGAEGTPRQPRRRRPPGPAHRPDLLPDAGTPARPEPHPAAPARRRQDRRRGRGAEAADQPGRRNRPARHGDRLRPRRHHHPDPVRPGTGGRASRRGGPVDRDRPPPHRRNRRARPADHPPGPGPHRRPASRRRRSRTASSS